MDILDQLHGAHWADASERLRLVNLAADEIERLRRLNSEYLEALEYIADMPDGWEEDEELNLMFVVDNHVKVASEVLLGPLANDKDCV